MDSAESLFGLLSPLVIGPTLAYIPSTSGSTGARTSPSVAEKNEQRLLPDWGGGATVLDNTVNCTHCVEWHSFRVWGFEVKRPDGGKTGVKPR